MLDHGGRLLRAALETGTRVEDWVDLSTGINPVPWPVPLLPPTCWSRLPEDEDDLSAAACEYYGTGSLLPVNGTQSAIQALPHLRSAGRVAVLSPAYAEHAHGWRRAGHEVIEADVPGLDRCIDDCDVVIVINPNNPTACIIEPERLLAWLERLQHRRGWLIVDEAFMDATPEGSLAGHGGREGLIILKSFGKFFGCPGARLGFVAAPSDLLHALHDRLGPWAVSGPARWVAQQAFADHGWQADTRRQLKQSSQRLAELLTGQGLVPSGGTALFQWVCTPFAQAIHDHFRTRCILLRLFGQPASLRFGLPASDEAWDRLAQALEDVPCGPGLPGVPQ